MEINHQTSTYIWCTLVFDGDDYARGAMVAAKSARDVETKYPFWCMVSDDVSDECKEILSILFDKIITVPIISHSCVPMKSKKQNEIYGPWIHKSFTKCNIFNPDLFPGVEKVLLVDADMRFLKNCDHLFSLNAPAMTFSSPWAFPYVKNSKSHGNFNPYYTQKAELGHGALVPRDKIEQGFKRGILGMACMVLVSPDTGAYKAMLKILDAKPLYGVSTTISGFDEQLFAETFLYMRMRVYNIHQQYNWVVGKKDWLLHGEIPSTHQFYNGKPWKYVKSIDDIDKSEWEDVRDWWYTAKSVIDLIGEKNKDWFFLTWNK